MPDLSAADTPTKLQRWLDVIAFLAARRYPVSREQLWEGVPAYASGLGEDTRRQETVRRMFERDKKDLIGLGIPIETLSFKATHYDVAEGYQLRRENFHLPYLRLLREAEGDRGEARPRSSTPVFQLRESEAAAALQGLRELASMPGFALAPAARSAFRKLAFDLEPDDSGGEAVVYARDPEAEASGELLKRLTPAVRRRKRVDFRYHAMSSDVDEARAVHPYGMLFQHGRWYLVGHDPARGAVRMFRVGRMRDVEVNARQPDTPDFDVPADFSLSKYAGRRAWELGPDGQAPTEATVWFRFPRSLWAERTRHGELVEEGPDGGQRRRFAVHRRDPFLRWVLSLAGDAWIESPDDLRDEFRALAARVAELHGASIDG